MQRALAIIPARWGASRLPGKPLLELGGRPMVVRVLEQVRAARLVEEVLVATDDERILRAVEDADGQGVLTRADHSSGTDRVAEAVRNLGRAPGVVVNVQGDMPLLDPDHLDALISVFEDPTVRIATASAPASGEAEARDPARVKVVTDLAGRALYFSREPIPAGGPWQLHVGLYAFRPVELLRFAAMAPTPLEQAEKLEQLRLLEHGIPVDVIPLPTAGLSVDTPADLERVRARFASASI